MIQFRCHFAVGFFGFVVACASARGTAGSQIGDAERFRDLPAVVMADSAEARPIPGTGHVRYPDEQRNRSIEAAFAFAFLLDTAGRVEYETVSFLGSAPTAFLSEACLWLRSQRFVPIRRDGIPRRTLVVSELSFTLDHSEHVGRTHPVTRAPVVNAEKSRREFAAKGVAQSARELEARRHCI
jgi:hypothetical protein